MNAQLQVAPLISVENRAFQYGDALFETIRMVQGQMPTFAYHHQRLERGLKFLGFNYPTQWQADYWQTEIFRLVQALEADTFAQNFRIRLQVYRTAEGYYRPHAAKAAFVITATSLSSQKFPTQAPGLRVGLFEQQAIGPAPLSNHKTSNSLPYVLAGIYAEQHQFDECLLLNTKGEVAEGYYSNLFIRLRDTWLTPPLSAGGVAGTCRAFLLDHAQDLGIRTEETEIRPEMIKNATAIWLTSAIRGIQWVKQYKNTTFTQGETAAVIQRMNQLLTPS